MLVAGGTGFLGSWLSRYLVSKGHEFTVLARQNSSTWRLGSEFEGDVVNYPPATGTPTQSAPTTQQPPRRGYSIHLIKKPGVNGANYQAKDAWLALSAVFPKDYPLAGPDNDGPAQHKVYEVVKNGSAVVKSGIGSEDIAETLVAKLVKFRVPYDCWEITSEDLNESVSNQLQSLLKSAGIVQNK
jgi:hypothetical protein